MNKIPLGAFDIITNEYVAPKYATKDKQYKCIDCENHVILRKGDIRVPHFAHYTQTSRCSYYEHPNETQLHKDAKFLMGQLLKDKRNIYFYRLCSECNWDGYFQGEPSINYKDGDEVIIEYRDKNNKYIADVAIVNNGEVRYIIEIKVSHETKTNVRPEPWYEVDARDLIDIVNESDKEVKEGLCTDDIIWFHCIRKNIVFRCYGSFCYKEQFVRLIHRYDKENKDNSCILCKNIDYEPLNDGDTGKFGSTGKLRICYPCMYKEVYEKKIRKMFNADKPVDTYVDKEYIEKNKHLLIKIPTIRKYGQEYMWRQDVECVNCGRQTYNPIYSEYPKKGFYAICKICFGNSDVIEKLETMKEKRGLTIIDDDE
jgi:hypothetical protein